MREGVLRFADGGWMELVGNHPGLDLVNTVSWRGDPARRVDRLSGPAELLRWSEFAGIVDGPTGRRLAQQASADPGAGTDALERVKELRELVHDVVLPVASGRRPAAADVASLTSQLRGALERAEVVSVMPIAWQPSSAVTLGALPDLLAGHAWQLLQSGDPDRLRQCQGEGCAWLFLDRSRNGSRLWCSSADCGNRTRARRHYRRHRADGSRGAST